MNRPQQKLLRRYLAALRKYLANEQEVVLEQAYELGRTAIAQGVGILEMTRIHLAAREKLLWSNIRGKKRERLSELVGNFLMQLLSPFEVTHRGACELNGELQQRNRELAEEIAERRHYEQALRESEQRYQTLIETAHDVIFSLSADGRIMAINRAFEDITGWPRSQWLGKPFAPLIHPEEMALSVERFQATVQGKPPEVWQYRVRKANGHYAVGEFTLVREMKNGKPVGVFGIGRDITERKRAEEALQELSAKIIRAREEERRRISRQLHDEVCQSLAAISVTLAATRNGGSARLEDASPLMTGTQRLLEGTMQRVHSFASELRPAGLDELGLLPVLRSHVQKVSECTGMRIRLRADSTAEALSDEQKTAIFRIVQESLAHAAKHAHASRVTISIRQMDDNLRLEISDNGKPFHAGPDDSGRERIRLDLLEMAERVRMFKGMFAIKPELGGGTTIRVTIPVSTREQTIGREAEHATTKIAKTSGRRLEVRL